MSASALKAYRRNDLQSAPKTEVLDRLFLRLDADFRAGQQAITAGDIVARSRALDHANRILTELIAALDKKAAPALCENLEALYRYCLTAISRASVERKASHLDQPIKIITTLRASFAEAAQSGT